VASFVTSRSGACISSLIARRLARARVARPARARGEAPRALAPILHEHQRELTERQVEAPVRERQCLGLAEVDSALLARSGRARDHAGSAGEIQHAIVGPEQDRIDPRALRSYWPRCASA
jgi:hypothetical protein